MRHRAWPWFAVVLSVLVASAPTSAGQSPHDSWMTRETRSFRVHYPAAWESWAEHVVERLEPVRDVVVDAVGYRPAIKVDVVLVDPLSVANGMAIPFSTHPRMVLWATPPGASSAIGNYHDWTDLLLLHEDVHLVHLLRPSRNPWERRFLRLVGFGPVSLDAPRWLTEGYATMLEGRLTGAGRPNGDFRAAILRARARAGRLPSYGALGSTGDGWQEGAMAYLTGSAFLEWLEHDAGPDALPDLWRRMSARERRDFDEAFEGVFGDSPARLYDRFVAEITWRALEVERAIGEGAREGETVLELAGATGAPAVSPDGERVAVVVGEPGESRVLALYELAPDDEAEADRRDEVEELLRLDPDDVAAVEPAVRARKRRHALPTRNDVAPHAPRFLPSGEQVLFHRFVPDADGVRRPDLYVWTPDGGAVRRVTRGADVRDADPAPDGSWAVAVRHRGQVSSLVRVDLADGGVTTLVAGRGTEVLDHPRISPDGERLVFLRHRAGLWRLTIRDLERGSEVVVGLPAGTSIARPAWHPDGSRIVAEGGRDGFVDLIVVDPARPGAMPSALTRSVDGAVAPDPARSGQAVVFLGMGHDGLDVRVAPIDPAPWDPAVAGTERALAPVVRSAPPADPPRADPREVVEAAPARPYGLGRAEFQPLGSWNLAPSANQFVLGARVGDIVGRWESLALVAGGSRPGARGVALAGAWRGWPLELRARAYVAAERPSEQELAEPSTGASLDLDRTGIEFSVLGARVFGPSTRGRFGAGAYAERIEPVGRERLGRIAVFAEGGARWRPSRGKTWARIDIGARADAGRTEDDDWWRATGELGLAVGRGKTGLATRGWWSEVGDAVEAFDRIALGGTDGAILPSPEVAGRVVVPALPVGTRIGDRYVGGRVALESSSRGLATSSLYWETHRMSGSGLPDEGALDLVGLEWTVSVSPEPLVRLPETTIRFGVANVLRDPTGALEGRTRAWITATFRP